MGEKEEEVSADETDSESEKKNDKAKEKGKKDKKEKKKDKKKDKKKSKTPTVSIERRKVADIVVETICNTSYFAGVSAIGKYPGRRYSKYGESYNPTAGLSLDSLNKASQSAKDVVN